MTKDGRKALLAYSALDRLRDGMGASQPWAVFPTGWNEVTDTVGAIGEGIGAVSEGIGDTWNTIFG